jgi:hypothetical protein
MKLRGEIMVDESGDQAAGRYVVEFLDPEGSVVSSTPTAGQFRRMKVEAMP